MKKLLVGVTDPHEKWLRSYAAKKDITISETIRRAVELFLKSEGRLDSD